MDSFKFIVSLLTFVVKGSIFICISSNKVFKWVFDLYEQIESLVTNNLPHAPYASEIVS